MIRLPCECEAEHGDSSQCRFEREARCQLCELEVCLNCMEGDEGRHCCTVCWDAIHVAELPECMETGRSHRATWMVAVSTSSPVVRIYVCPEARAVYDGQGYQAARLVRVHADGTESEVEA